MGEDLTSLLLKFKEGKISLDDIEKKIKLNYIENLETLRLDINRKLRSGIPEVVYGRGKEINEIIKATLKLAEKNGCALATKIDDIKKLKYELNNYDLNNYTVKINERGKTLTIFKKDFKINYIGKVGIITAGTADIPIAEEAKETLNFLGVESYTYYDIGVAGIHRVFPVIKEIIKKDIRVIIVVAGMEGALPSVVSSLVDIPVIGVPTSTGYGFPYTPLFTMLNSCSPGLAVVNIDNGFGAACFAYLIVRHGVNR